MSTNLKPLDSSLNLKTREYDGSKTDKAIVKRKAAGDSFSDLRKIDTTASLSGGNTVPPPSDPRVMTFNLREADSPLPVLESFYEQGDRIGRGGFCDIHASTDKCLMRPVAVKTLQEDKDSRYSCRSAFLTEARMTAFLDHPNIVPVYGLYTDSNRHLHLVMKRIEGITLKKSLKSIEGEYATAAKKRIRTLERRRIPERLEIFLKVCDAIQYAHFKNVLHRDLKPANIMIGDFHEVYVMDWGIAEHSDVNTLARISGQLSGTPQYVAPEIVNGKSYDSRSDIYSLGVILFELVFLGPAFDPDPEKTLVDRVSRHEIAAPKHVFHCHVSSVLKKIVLKAIAANPDARYQTVELLAEDLRSYLHLKNGSASSFGWFHRLFDWF